MDKFLLIALIALSIGLIGSLILVLGIKRQGPIGKKGIIGTSLEHSKTLRKIEIIFLGVLIAACDIVFLIAMLKYLS